ncbi:hypothetical protein LTR85_011083 [Meristemomyces frigidus]|nr:hypothetical protein LTR85_011083 [Meristemomyces frigidus]
MSLASLPSALRATALSASRRTFSTSSTERASILFALNALSNSRETQHFNKLSHLPRIEHSPPLKLIKTSEVDPHPLPTPPPRAAQPLVRTVGEARSVARVWDDKALRAGRALLADQARQTSRLQRALERAKRREARQDAVMQKDRQAWQQEAKKLRNEMRAAGVWIVMSIGTATALATWRFLPRSSALAADSGEMGRKIAERARRAIPLPAAVSAEPTVAAPAVTAPIAQTAAPLAPAFEPALTTVPSHTPTFAPSQAKATWWRGLFWKQQ